MTKDDALIKIKAALKSVTGRDLDITLDSDLAKFELLDSLDTINLMFKIEEAFGVKLPDGDIIEQGLYKMDNLTSFLIERQ